MQALRLQFSDDGKAQWAGMADLVLVAPDGVALVDMPYVGEPPFGDSYHAANVNGHALPGYFWGCMFAFSACSRYLVGSWMPAKYARQTAVFDLQLSRYFVLPTYLYDFRVAWPAVEGVSTGVEGMSYTFTGSERWQAG